MYSRGRVRLRRCPPPTAAAAAEAPSLSLGRLPRRSCSCRYRALRAKMLCTTLVRSRQSMQLVRTTPFWTLRIRHGTATAAALSPSSSFERTAPSPPPPATGTAQKYPCLSRVGATSSSNSDRRSHLPPLHSAWKSNHTCRTASSWTRTSFSPEEYTSITASRTASKARPSRPWSPCLSIRFTMSNLMASAVEEEEEAGEAPRFPPPSLPSSSSCSSSSAANPEYRASSPNT
mmetsp:Transcript_50555/g.152328  ORF Transcript_50555/g.152328 Transcript_50555/m.152328 type:complete len:232 (+) Transcript_50555:2889-3584(+)